MVRDKIEAMTKYLNQYIKDNLGFVRFNNGNINLLNHKLQVGPHVLENG